MTTPTPRNHMKWMMIGLTAASLGLLSCDTEGVDESPMEEAAEETNGALEEATDDVENTVE